jgi:phosphoserine aminotransferase
MKKFNFAAGPSIINASVMKEAIENIDNTKHLSILELSHRGKIFKIYFNKLSLLLKN